MKRDGNTMVNAIWYHQVHAPSAIVREYGTYATFKSVPKLLALIKSDPAKVVEDLKELRTSRKRRAAGLC